MNNALRNSIARPSLRAAVNSQDLVIDSGAASSLRPVQPGHCLDMVAASNHYIDSGVTVTGGTAVDISFTINPDLIFNGILGCGANVAADKGFFLVITAGAVSIFYSDGTTKAGQVFTGLTLSASTWYDCRLVWDGGASVPTLTVNGVDYVTASVIAGWAGVSADNMILGAYNGGSTGHFDGKLGFCKYDGVFQYNNDFSSGTSAIDSSGNNNDGTLVNGPSWTTDNSLPYSWLNQVGYTDVSGLLTPRDESDPTKDTDGNPLQWSGSAFPRRPEYRGSYGVSFDGTDDYIDSGVATASDTYIEATIKKSAVVNTRYAFGCNNSSGTERIYVDDRTGLFRAIIGTSSDTLDFAATTGMIYTLRLYTNGDFYVDGVLVGNTGGTMDVAEDVYFGARNNGGSPATYWGGEMYGASVYSSGALTTYTLSEGVGATAHDISGNGNDGTITNASTATEGAGFWAGRIDGEANAHNINNGFSRRMLFDGVNDYVKVDGTPYNTKTKGKITFDFATSASGSTMSFAAFVDETDTDSDFGLGMLSTGEVFVQIREAGVSAILVQTNDSFNDDVKHSFEIEVTDSGNLIKVDDVAVAVTYSIGNAATKTWINSVNDVDVLSIGNTQELVPSKFYSGVVYNFSLYDEDGTTAIGQWNGNGNTDADWLDTVGSNNGTVVGSPALLRVPADSAAPTLDVYGSTLTNPAVANSHNDAETTWDFENIGTGDTIAPETSHLSNFDAVTFSDTNYSLGITSPIDSVFWRDKSGVLKDRGVAFGATLTGAGLVYANNYTDGERWNNLAPWDDDNIWND